mmetsp:Transcript_43570/g.87850  ORF Transcript_43570/g.87850 Transcript_43570/m.87850 type:complete len:268 (-) Transcript_43570:172-975(-)
MSLTAADAALASAFVAPAAPRALRALQSHPEIKEYKEGSSAASLAIGASSIAAVVAVGGSAVLAGRRRGVQASAGKARAAVVVQAGPKVLEGTGGPFPDDFWDPAGLAKGKSDEQLIHWRNVELKHGRVCMLACLGWFHVAAGWHPIGDAAARMRVSDDPLIAVSQLPIGGAFQVIFTIMCLEWMTTYVVKPPAEKPWDILGWTPVLYDDTPDWKETQLKELNNGRLAMMGIIGLISQDMLTGDYFAGIGQPGFGAWIEEPAWSPPY